MTKTARLPDAVARGRVASEHGRGAGALAWQQKRSIPPRSINCHKGFGSKPLAILDGVDSEGLRVLFGEAHAVVADAETLLAALVLQGLDAARAGIPPADEWR